MGRTHVQLHATRFPNVKSWPARGLVVAALCVAIRITVAADSLPARIADADYWSMIDRFSEEGGTFASDNRISNEIAFQQVIPELQERAQSAYLGVGPEQNLTYIVALKPRIAFIVDIRRQNLLLHLVYKALIEMSDDRVDFMSRLFARPRPGGVTTGSGPRALFDAFAQIGASESLAKSTLRALLEHLERTHKFPLSPSDERAIDEIYTSLYLGGPEGRGNFGGGPWIPSYGDLMTQTDLGGQNHSYLASEDNYRTIKDYETKNLIVPLVGDFAGDRTLRAVGRYLKEQNATVTTFYTSNVEEYLFRNNTWSDFARNVSTLPLDDHSIFIRTFFTYSKDGLRTLLDPIPGLLAAFSNGGIRNYGDVVTRSTSPAR
jgi:hypothetical protein